MTPLVLRVSKAAIAYHKLIHLIVCHLSHAYAAEAILFPILVNLLFLAPHAVANAGDLQAVNMRHLPPY